MIYVVRVAEGLAPSGIVQFKARYKQFEEEGHQNNIFGATTPLCIVHFLRVLCRGFHGLVHTDLLELARRVARDSWVVGENSH